MTYTAAHHEGDIQPMVWTEHGQQLLAAIFTDYTTELW